MKGESRKMSGIAWLLEWERKRASTLKAIDPFNIIDDADGPCVYFLRDPVAGEIKIGVSDGQLIYRVKSLQAGNPRQLTVAASCTCPMDGMNASDRRALIYKTETMLHSHFRESRIHGEWFRPSAPLLALIEGLRSGPTVLDLDKYLHL